jgi:AcrR family transcriptional regulator
VTRYFGSKQDLFATATEFRIELPDLTGAAPDDIADMLLPRYFVVWEDDHSFLALLRAASTSRIAADTLNETLATHVAPTLRAVTPDKSPTTDRHDGCVRHRARHDEIRAR